MKTIWNKETGEAHEYEAVDAREILKNSDEYTDQNPNAKKAKDPDGDGVEGAPQNVANVENEFRREPVGDDPPAPPRQGTIIRNPVSDRPRMADPAATTSVAAVDPEALNDMTVAELKDHAESRNIDLGDAHLKADIIKKIKKA